MKGGITMTYWDGSEFDRSFNIKQIGLCLQAHLLLPRYTMGKFAAFSITLLKPGAQGLEGILMPRDVFFDRIDVVEIYRDFDRNAFDLRSAGQQRREIWDIIFANLRHAAMQFNADMQPIESAYAAGLKGDLYLKHEFKVPMHNSVKHLIPTLLLRQLEDDTFLLSLSLVDKRTEKVTEHELMRFGAQKAESILFSVKKMRLAETEVEIQFQQGTKKFSIV